MREACISLCDTPVDYLVLRPGPPLTCCGRICDLGLLRAQFGYVSCNNRRLKHVAHVQWLDADERWFLCWTHYVLVPSILYRMGDCVRAGFRPHSCSLRYIGKHAIAILVGLAQRPSAIGLFHNSVSFHLGYKIPAPCILKASWSKYLCFPSNIAGYQR